MKIRTMVRLGLATAVLAAAGTSTTYAQKVVVDDVFSAPYSGWVDAYPDRLNGSNWRISLHNPTLMETHNANLPNTGGITNGGNFEPSVLVQDGFVAPSDYNLRATMYTNDDDIFGLVFNYVDPDNYFRVGIRPQAAGSFGGTQGLSVQKFVNGTMTQVFPADPGDPKVTPIPLNWADTRQQFEMGVVVENGTFDILLDGVSQLPAGPIADGDLSGGGKIGFQSWAQSHRTSSLPHWGTEIEQVTVSDSTGALYSESFDRTVYQWRELNMLNATGGGPISGEGGRGNFGIDINDSQIIQVSNSYQWATTEKPHTDFVGPAIVLDEPGSENYGDYEMRVRLQAGDNDGIGVLLRVQDDDTFYRINFASEAMGTNGQRPPQGLSVQKVIDGEWSELFRDDQENLAFAHWGPSAGPTAPTPILPIMDPRDYLDEPVDGDDQEAYVDLAVRAIGNTLDISVTGWDIISQTFKTHRYDLIVDDTDPLLTGTVGLTTFGNANSIFSQYGGAAVAARGFGVGGNAFLTAIPEPSTVGLVVLSGVALVGLARRRRG